MERIAVENYIREEMEVYRVAFGNTNGFKEYITRKLKEKIKGKCISNISTKDKK